MKKILIFMIAGLYAGTIWGQKTTTPVVRSTSSAPIKIISMGADTLADVPSSQFPVELIISDLSFTGTENEGFITADERGYLHFRIQNIGQGDAYNLRLYTSETSGLDGLKYDNHKFIAKQFKSGETRLDSIYIEGKSDLRDGRARLELILREANGFRSPATETSFFTRQASKPNIDVLSQDIYWINEREMRVQMTLKNTGSSNMKDVKVNINYPKTVFAKGDNVKTLDLLKPDESTEVEFTFVKNQNFYDAVKDVFKVLFEDANGQQLGMQREIVRTSLAQAGGAGATVVTASNSTLSDIDLNIPVSTNEVKNEHTYALIIGNEKYTGNQEVPYAIRDANIFREYCVRTFNIPRGNITLLNNATGNQMKNSIRDLARKARYDESGEAELIIYYSGHGIIDRDRFSMAEDEFDQFLIPVDVAGADASLSVSRKEIYAALDDVSFKRASIFLDACNVKGDRAVAKVAKYEWKGNVFVFSSSSPSQTSGPYNEKGHGLFTYFLLKNIQDKKGKIDYRDLTEKVISEVERQSDMAGKMQNPEVITSPRTGESWKNWKLPE
ncbi:MAG: caspase family protein [Tannerellaceae bacterium]|jgi:hypothetical protein|nr:caspase family protein [Tannerellaceae bacterium]